jgi:hypothetical protein
MILKKIKSYVIRNVIQPFNARNKVKVFCIGMNKTGTTSLGRTFRELGFEVGNQTKAERLLPEYRLGNFDAIIRYTKSAQVFQDIPFSLPNTYRYLRETYPNAKFILTVRDNPEQWANSLKKFHSKVYGKGNAPTYEQLKNSSYVYRGFALDAMECLQVSKEDPYEKTNLMRTYNKYNSDVEEHFMEFKGCFLKLNLSDKDSFQQFIDFLGIQTNMTNFPWENKTSELKVSQ